MRRGRSSSGDRSSDRDLHMDGVGDLAPDYLVSMMDDHLPVYGGLEFLDYSIA